MPPRNVFIILVTAIVSLACHLKAERSRYAAQLGEAMNLVEKLYLEEVPPRKLFENAMHGLADGLDEYSSYVEPQPFEEMNQTLDQEFGGVGIEVDKAEDNQPIVVLSPMFGSPGYRAGLRSGDSILAIDGVSTIGLKQRDAIPKMRGKPGSKVRLRVQHSGEPTPIDIEVVREIIKVDSLLGDKRREDSSWDYHLQENPRIGYLRLTTFGQHSAVEAAAALKGGDAPFQAVILDLRNNAGGLLDVAVELCDLFLKEGRIVSTRGRDGKDRTVHEATPDLAIPASVPIVLLVNKYSASASEILAACLQDHGRAIVVGDRSWGKGTVQNLFDLEGGRSALRLTTASYWRPSGKNIHRRKGAPENEEWGVRPTPGFEVKVSDEELAKIMIARRDRDLGRPTKTEDGKPPVPVDDPQLRKAIEHLKQALDKPPATSNR